MDRDDAYEETPAAVSEIRERRIAYALDASAVLAMLQAEPGGELVEMVIDLSRISSVNWSEVVQKAAARGAVVDGMRRDFEELGLVVEPFTGEDAETAAELWETGRSAGLSLGDRACLALATRLGAPALTTDRAWADLALEGVEVELLR